MNWAEQHIQKIETPKQKQKNILSGVSVKMLIENWLSDAGQTALVKH